MVFSGTATKYLAEKICQSLGCPLGQLQITKFSDGEFVIDKDYSLRLRNKIAAFKAATKTKKSLVPTMITTFGVKRNQYSGKVQQEVVLDDLFVGK